jgi:uncharacterized protein (TIGR02246 family)
MVTMTWSDLHMVTSAPYVAVTPLLYFEPFPHSEVSMTDDERAIRDLVETWMTASRAGDAQMVLSLMADDVVFLVPGRAPFGKDVFRAGAEAMKGVHMDGTSNIIEIKVLGDWAYMRNHIDVTITPPGGSAMRRTGYTLSVLHKQPNGKWLLARDANLVA